jgi:hypothetical protein
MKDTSHEPLPLFKHIKKNEKLTFDQMNPFHSDQSFPLLDQKQISSQPNAPNSSLHSQLLLLLHHLLHSWRKKWKYPILVGTA